MSAQALCDGLWRGTLSNCDFAVDRAAPAAPYIGSTLLPVFKGAAALRGPWLMARPPSPHQRKEALG
jgi:hypothetical protein